MLTEARVVKIEAKESCRNELRPPPITLIIGPSTQGG
jgi:hypothetical protein